MNHFRLLTFNQFVTTATIALGLATAAPAIAAPKASGIVASPAASKEIVNAPITANTNGAMIEYSLVKAGRVSLAVYDASGKMVRTLLSAQKQEVGKKRAAWDGLDSDGKPVVPGEYSWKLLLSQGMKAEYLMALGTSTGINHWVGQHGGPNAIVVDGDAFTVGGAPEGSPMFARMKFDGTYQFPITAPEATNGVCAVAIDGGNFYSLLTSGSLWTFETMQPKVKTGAKALFLPMHSLGGVPATTGSKTLTFDVEPGRYMVSFKMGQEGAPSSKVGVNVQDSWDELPAAAAGKYVTVARPTQYYFNLPKADNKGKLTIKLTELEKDKPWAIADMTLLTPADNVDARFGELVATYPAAKTVAWIDSQTGKALEKIGNVQVSKLAVVAPGRVLGLRGNDVIEVTRDGRVETKITDLVSPGALAFDVASGGLWIAEGGASQQVKYFGKNFKLSKTFGRKGGREQGLYVPDNFLEVAAIAGDGKGGFLVTEADSAPRRTARFDGAGKLLKEWYGGQQFYTFAAVNPHNPNRIWMDSQWGWVMEIEVDWQKRDWKVISTYAWPTSLSASFLEGKGMAIPHSVRTLDLNKDGTAEMYLVSGNQPGSMLLVDEAARKLRPVALFGLVNSGQQWGEGGHAPSPSSQPQPWVEAMERAGGKGKRIHNYRGFGWADANDDGQLQSEELVVGNGGRQMPFFLGNDLSLYLGADFQKGNQNPAWQKIPATGGTKDGYPIWDWNKRELGPTAGFSSTMDLRLGAAGAVYTIEQNGGGDGFIADNTYGMGHGGGWPSNQIDSNAVIKWNAAGEKMWQVAPHASRGGVADQLNFPVHFAGIAYSTIGVCDKVQRPVVFWTDDGLYAGSLFDRRPDDGLPSRIYKWWMGGTDDYNTETGRSPIQCDMALGGSLLKLGNGDVVFVGSGWNNCPAYKVTGWDEFQRQSGKIVVKAPAASATQNGEGLKGEYSTDAKLIGEPVLTQTEKRIWFDSAKKPEYSGVSYIWPAAATGKNAFAARWTGLIEPKFSEEYSFGLYARNGAARLWIGGQLVAVGNMIGASQGGDWKIFSPPVLLSAGKKYVIRVEWSGGKGSAFHLNWESGSQPISHVPMSALYLPSDTALPVIALKPSTQRTTRPHIHEKSANAEWIFTRSVATGRPLDIDVKWSGTAQAGKNFAALPTQIHFTAGQSEVRVPLQTLPSTQAAAASMELTGQPRLSSDYLLDGTDGAATMLLSDPECKRIEVAGVTGEGARVVDWASPNIHTEWMKRLINGSGLDRSVDPPLHDTNINNAWLGEVVDPDKSFLVFDLGALYDVSDIQVWNLNTTSAHGMGWGEGPSVRDYTPRIRILVSDSAAGPWTDLGVTNLRVAGGKAPDAGQLIPIGKAARFVRFAFSKPTNGLNIGLAEVEFFGKAK